MTRGRQSQLIPIGIPSRGISSRYAPANIPPEFALFIRDFEYDSGVLGTPLGAADEFDPTDTYVSAMAAHPSNADLIIFVDSADAVSGTLRYNTWNPFTATAGTAGTVAVGSVAAEPQARSLSFGERVFFFFFGNQPMVTDGTTYATVGFTGPTLVDVVSGFSYRSRMYVFEHLSQSVWYGATGGIAGAFTEYPLKNITTDNGVVMCGFTFTLSKGDAASSVWCVVMDTGEVIAYIGPDPADSGWVLAGKMQIAPPVGYQSIIEVNGDVLVITKQGIVSMRQLFVTPGGQASVASITDEVEKLWGFVIDSLEAYDAPTSYDPRSSFVGRIKGGFHPQENKLVVHIPGAVNVNPASSTAFGYLWTDPTPGGEGQEWVYDFTHQAWTIKGTGLEQGALCVYYHPRTGVLLFAGNGSTAAKRRCYRAWGHDEYTNESLVARNVAITTGALPIPAKKRITGLSLSHFGIAATKKDARIRFVSEYGAKTSSYTSIQAAESKTSRDVFNTGLEGELIQWQMISGADTAVWTKPYQLLNASVIVEPGGVVG